MKHYPLALSLGGAGGGDGLVCDGGGFLPPLCPPFEGGKGGGLGIFLDIIVLRLIINKLYPSYIADFK